MTKMTIIINEIIMNQKKHIPKTEKSTPIYDFVLNKNVSIGAAFLYGWLSQHDNEIGFSLNNASIRLNTTPHIIRNWIAELTTEKLLTRNLVSTVPKRFIYKLTYIPVKSAKVEKVEVRLASITKSKEFDIFYQEIVDWFSDYHPLKVVPKTVTIQRFRDKFRKIYKSNESYRIASNFTQAGEAILEECEDWCNGKFKLQLVFFTQRNFFDTHFDKRVVKPQNIKKITDSGEFKPVNEQAFDMFRD